MPDWPPADVIDHLRRFVVGAEDYLNYWVTRERSDDGTVLTKDL
jgi:hypothetical protein